MAKRRFPQAVYSHSTEPDPRFSLANERTFLAWIRTSLALVAAGVALEALDLPIQEDLRFTSAILFVVLGLIAAANAWVGWAMTEVSLRRSRALPSPTLSIVLSGGVILATALIGVGLFL